MTCKRTLNSKLKAWLLPVALMLTIFTFSGTGNITIAKPNRAATEQIDRIFRRQSSVFEIYGFKPATWVHQPKAYFLQISTIHTAVTFIQIGQCSKDCLGFTAFNPATLHSPRNSGEYFSIS